MSEKLYKFLLKLYPDHFRRTYGDEALRLVRDRARSESGFLFGLRLWMDLFLDVATSLPREYSQARITAIAATAPLEGELSFGLLAKPSLHPTLLCLAGTLSAVSFWGCLFVVAHSGGFPALFPAPLSPQGIAQSTEDRDLLPSDESSAPSFSAGAYSVCVTAKRDIPSDSEQPLFAFQFARPGASGVALIDGKVVRRFKNQQRLSIRAHVFAGDHQFVLHLDRPAGNPLISTNDDFGSCQAK
jgi:hypothetical protein